MIRPTLADSIVQTALVMRILIVDDDDQMRSLIGKMLDGTGHDVVVAPDGKAGLGLIDEQPPDVVVTDILMPETDGLELIYTLRRDFPDVKIIAISGCGETGYLNFLSEAEEFGADETLRKPFTRAQLLETIERVLF